MTHVLMVLSNIKKPSRWDYVITLNPWDKAEFAEMGYVKTSRDPRDVFPAEHLALIRWKCPRNPTENKKQKHKPVEAIK